MARKRRNQKRKHKSTQENTRNYSSATKREDFLWNKERKLALLNCMIKRKPAGLHKHINLLLIKSQLSEYLKVDVPIKAIWNFLHVHWNMKKADRIEYQALKIKNTNFELPQTEEWTRLIKEQGALINSKNTNTDYITFSNLRLQCKQLSRSCYINFISKTQLSLVSKPKQFWKFINDRKQLNTFPKVIFLNNKTAQAVPQLHNKKPVCDIFVGPLY